MTYVLLVSKEEQELELLSNELGKGAGITVGKCSSGKEALDLVVNNKIDVVVATEELSDGDGITFIKNLTKKQPLINSALVSVLPPADFHEATEGLGVFMQLPLNSGAPEAEQMLRLLESINVLLAK